MRPRASLPRHPPRRPRFSRSKNRRPSLPRSNSSAPPRVPPRRRLHRPPIGCPPEARSDRSRLRREGPRLIHSWIGGSRMAPVVSGVLFLAVFEAWSTQARADVSPTDRALAQSLFDQALHLRTAGKTPEACPNFAESYRLDPAGGTLLNLAVCHETEGKTATAWSEFKDAKSLARRDGRKDREKLANDHIQSLESKLSRITISVPPSTSDAQGLEVKLQGASIGKAAWGTSMPVDPGPLEVSASAPGKKPWSTRVNL